MCEVLDRMCELLEEYPDDGEPFVWFGFEMNQDDLAAIISSYDDRVKVTGERVTFLGKRIWVNNELSEVTPNIGVMQEAAKKKTMRGRK